MKKFFPPLLILLSGIMSCSDDDDKVVVNLQLTKVTLNQTLPIVYDRTILFDYNRSGSLSSYKEQNLEGVLQLEAIHSYSAEDQLISISKAYPQSGEVTTYEFTYQGQGPKLSKTIIKSLNGLSNNPFYHTFFYDGSGRIRQVNLSNDPEKPRTAFVLELMPLVTLSSN